MSKSFSRRRILFPPLSFFYKRFRRFYLESCFISRIAPQSRRIFFISNGSCPPAPWTNFWITSKNFSSLYRSFYGLISGDLLSRESGRCSIVIPVTWIVVNRSPSEWRNRSNYNRERVIFATLEKALVISKRDLVSFRLMRSSK